MKTIIENKTPTNEAIINALIEDIRANNNRHNFYAYTGIKLNETIHAIILDSVKPSAIDEARETHNLYENNYIMFAYYDSEAKDNAYKKGVYYSREYDYFTLNNTYETFNKIYDPYKKANKEKARINAKKIVILYQPLEQDEDKKLLNRRANFETTKNQRFKLKNTYKYVINVDFQHKKYGYREGNKEDYDKNGYFIRPLLEDLKCRARQLKHERRQAEFNASNLEKEAKKIAEQIATLKVLMYDITTDFISRSQYIKRQDFFFADRIEVISDLIQYNCELLERIKSKDFASVEQFNEVYNNNQARYQKVIFYTNCYKNAKTCEDFDATYNYYKIAIDENGNCYFKGE